MRKDQFLEWEKNWLRIEILRAAVLSFSVKRKKKNSCKCIAASWLMKRVSKD